MKNIFLIIFTLFFVVSNALGQDRLLLTNGRIKNLKGTVFYYDHDEVLYQNERQVNEMKAFLAFKNKQEEAYLASESWKIEKERRETKALRKKQKDKARIEAKRADFEKDVKDRMENLSPADFEKWKNRQLDRIKATEQEAKLEALLEAQLKDERKNKIEARERARFSKRVSRDLVFSILKPDSTEIVVYNADTLGYFADGEADVEYNIEEMRLYIKGRQDGRKHSFHDVAIGAGVGMASAFLFTWTWDLFYAPIPPAICIGVMAGFVRDVRPVSKNLESIQYLWSGPYMDGYQRSAKGRKILAFTIGSLGGLAVGLPVAVFTSPLLKN